MWEQVGVAAADKVLAETTGLDLLNAGSSVLGAAMTPAPAGPSRAESGIGYEDHSGWTVNTGSGSASAAALSPWLLGLIAFGMVLWFKAKKS